MHLGNDGLSPYTPFINLTILGFDPCHIFLSGMIITESALLAVFITLYPIPSKRTFKNSNKHSADGWKES